MVWSIASWRPLAVFTFAKNDLARFRIENEFSRQKRSKMFGNTDWSHAGPAAAVWNAKGLVQIQMANVCAVIPGTAKTDLGIHVRAVHVNLTAVRVHDVANFANRCFENAVRGGIGHHQRGEIACVLIGFGAQIGKIDISIFQTGDRHNFETGHDRTRRVRSVSRCWNQTNIAMRFTPGRVIFADREQPRVFSLRSGIGLQ